MIYTGRYKRITPSRCDYCKAVIDRVEVAITLRGNWDNPTEYGYACPECHKLDSFTNLDEEAMGRYCDDLEAEAAILRRQLAGAERRLAERSGIGSAAEIAEAEAMQGGGLRRSRFVGTGRGYDVDPRETSAYHD